MATEALIRAQARCPRPGLCLTVMLIAAACGPPAPLPPPPDLDELPALLPGDSLLPAFEVASRRLKFKTKGPPMGMDRSTAWLETGRLAGRSAPAVLFIIDPGSAADTILLDPETFALIERRFTNPIAHYRIDLRVTPDSANATLEKLEGADPELPDSLKGALPHPVFELNSIDLVLAAAKLTDGVPVKLPYLELSRTPSVQWLRVESMGLDSIAVGATEELRAVRVFDLHSSTGDHSTMSIDLEWGVRIAARFDRTGRRWSVRLQ